MTSQDCAAGLVVRTYRAADEEAVVALWRRCKLVAHAEHGTWNDPKKDIADKVSYQPELFFVGEIDGRMVATVMAGYEGHRGWINYLAVSPEYQRRGIGTVIMRRAERALQALGCPKINLQVRESNHSVVAFYKGLGFSVERRISLGKRLGQRGEQMT
jgi:ribosomal protein S18 acetylase RimI-like enzyme